MTPGDKKLYFKVLIVVTLVGLAVWGKIDPWMANILVQLVS